MAGRGVIEVHLDGVDELLEKLKGNKLYAEPFREAFGKIGQLMHRAADAAAPVGLTHQLKGRLTHRMQATAVPTWYVVKTVAVAQSTSGKRRKMKSAAGRSWSYPYPCPRRLNFEPGNPHFGWLTNAKDVAISGAVVLLSQAIRQIEQRWRR